MVQLCVSYEDFLKGISSFALALLHLHNSDHVLLTLYSNIVDIQLFFKTTAEQGQASENSLLKKYL